jgi:4-hydroxy-tetrahydrodipicolinate synthase
MTGAMTALITPFKNGKVDSETFAKLIQRQIDNGIDYVVPVGTTGESATLSHNEHKECIEIAVEVCKNSSAKVLAGAGSNSTAEAIDLAKFAESCGADAILSVSPYYNKPTQKGIFEHYKAIANSIDIEVVLYNVPGRTNSHILPDTAINLSKICPNITTVKEASGDVSKVIEYQSKNQKLDILSGDDAINYAVLACGGKGVISVTSNLLPKKISNLVHSANNGDLETSKKINEELYEINKILFIESNPIPIKYAMHLAGLCELEYRLPLTEPSEENKKKIEEVVKKYL